MLKNCFIIFMFCLPFLSMGQRLTLDEILNLRKQNLPNVEENLLSRGWEFSKGEDVKGDSYGIATFMYVNNSNNTEMVLDFIYSNITEPNRVMVIIFNNKLYNAFLNQIKGMGCKLIKSKIIGGKVMKLYQGKTTSFEIAVNSGEINNSYLQSYAFFILNNEDYNKNFEKRYD